MPGDLHVNCQRDFAVAREGARLLLAVNGGSVEFDLELPAGADDQFRFDV